MNKLFPQWKKILAHKYFLLSMCVIVAVFLYMIINLIGHTFQYIHTKPIGANVLLFNQEFTSYMKPHYKFGKPIVYTLFAPLSPFKKFWLLYVLIFLLAFIFVWRKVYQMRIAYKDLNMGSDGTTRWTTVEELKQQYKMIPVDSTQEYEGKSGVPVATVSINDVKYYFIDTNNTNTDVLGSTQSGKTQLFTYPMIDIISRAEIKDSMVINDVKADITLNTRKLLESRGYKVVVINTIDPANSARINELHDIAKNYFESRKLSHGDLRKNRLLDRAVEGIKDFTTRTYYKPDVKDTTWQEGAMSLVNATLYILCEQAYKQNNIKLVNVTALIDLISNFSKENSDGTIAFDLYIESLPRTHMAKKLFETMKVSSTDQRSSFMISVLPALSIYVSRGVSEMTSENDFDFEELAFGDKPVALFILVPDVSEANYKLVSSVYTRIFQVLGYKSMFSQQTELPRRIHLIVEESMNILKLNGLARGMNMNLERGIVTHLIHQSNSQVYDRYGEKEGDAILGACGNHIFIMSDDDKDAKSLSSKMGNSTIIKMDRTGSDLLNIDKSYRESEGGRPLMYPDELLRLRPSEWVVTRTKKRTDLNGNPIDPTPIFASLENNTAMIHAGSHMTNIESFVDKTKREGLETVDFRTRDKAGNLIHDEFFDEEKYLIDIEFLKPFSEVASAQIDVAFLQAQQEKEKALIEAEREEQRKVKQFMRGAKKVADVKLNPSIPISKMGKEWLTDIINLCEILKFSQIEMDQISELTTVRQLKDFVKCKNLVPTKESRELKLKLEEALLGEIN